MQDVVALLFCKHGQPAQKRQSGIDQRRQLPGEDHQRLGLDRLLLKEDDVLAKPRRSLPAPLRLLRACAFLLVRAAFAFLEHVGREITSLTQLTDRFVGRIGVNQAGRFLAAGVEGYVGVSGA